MGLLLLSAGGDHSLFDVICAALGGWLIVLAMLGIASVATVYANGDESVPRFCLVPWSGIMGVSAGAGLGFLVVLDRMQNGELNDRLALLLPGAALGVVAGMAMIIHSRRRKAP